MSLWRRIYDERRGVILPLAIALAVNVAVLLLGVIPMQAGLAAATRAEQEAVADLASARVMSDQARDTALSRQNATEDLRRFYGSILPADLATARKTTNLWLQQAALDAGLTFRTQQFETAPVEGSALSRASATVQLEGRYADVRRLLYAVERAEEFMVIEHVNLLQSGAATDAGNDRLGVELAVSTYFPTPASK